MNSNPLNFPIVLNTFRCKPSHRASSLSEDQNDRRLPKENPAFLHLPKLKPLTVRSHYSPTSSSQFEVIGSKKARTLKDSKLRTFKVRRLKFSSKLMREVCLSVDFDNDYY
jgi:hypothetical protein